MIEVFFTTAPTTEERKRMAEECLAWWKSQPVKLHVLTPEFAKCSIPEFNRERRIVADRLAQANHIVADDDAIPQCDILQAFDVSRKYRDFGTLSLWPQNCNIQRWTEIEAFEDDEVMEHNSVGIIRFCQKGMPFPPSERLGYDRTHADAIRAIGMKVGLLKNFKVLHLGEGIEKSTIWNKPNQ